MFFKTKDECVELMGLLEVDVQSAVRTARNDDGTKVRVVFEHEPAYRLLGLARNIVSFIEPFDWSLLWATEWGVWGSSNWHLYYRLRQSYGDYRELIRAPGHFFLQHEAADLTTFLDMALRFGWDCHLAVHRIHCFVSHDGWLTVNCPDMRDTVRQSLTEAEFRIK